MSTNMVQTKVRSTKTKQMARKTSYMWMNQLFPFRNADTGVLLSQNPSFDLRFYRHILSPSEICVPYKPAEWEMVIKMQKEQAKNNSYFH